MNLLGKNELYFSHFKMTIKIFIPEQIFLIKCSQMSVTKHSTTVNQKLTNIIFAGSWWDLQPPDPWVLLINSTP